MDINASDSAFTAISPAPSQQEQEHEHEQKHKREPKLEISSHIAYETPVYKSHGANILPPISDERKRNAPPLDLPSPPVTPSTAHKRRRIYSSSSQLPGETIPPSATSPKQHQVDPVLFPSSSAELPRSRRPASPLFDSKVSDIVNKHIAENQTKPLPAKPSRDEYMFALSCVPVVSKLYNKDPVAWHQREQEILQRQLCLIAPRNPAAAAATMGVGMTGISATAAGQHKRIPPVKKPPVSATARLPKPRVRRTTPRSTPRPRTENVYEPRYQVPTSPKPVRPIGTSRDDVDYNSLPDYSPPTDKLQGNSKALKADWKGQMLDLSRDPDRHMLDPAEVNLAATLRLSCATYLCSKRRIFEARLNALRIGKEFRKTDAQQACKIDVNKASKLWTAYDRVGWFKPEYFKKYL
ncbi:hypothetical protein KEM54_006210 [Ascosphaera aggregata]|nr:hypothetical protein KEM54_006210 [Ascosphaera aggregata]